jgi:tRNA dimethylallyltransferase
VAEALATEFGGEIMSVDSMQVYRGMDIGTAKPAKETLERIRHYMVGIVDPFDDYDVNSFQRDATPVIDDASAHGKRLVISGGSGLHFRAVVDPMSFAPTDPKMRFALEALPRDQLQAQLRAVDPEVDSIVDMSNRRRLVRALEVYRLTDETPTQRHMSPEAEAVRQYVPAAPHLSIGFDAGESAHARASARFHTMVDSGLLAEVTGLGASMSRNASQAVGYKEMLPVIAGERTLADGVAAALTATRKLVKRQRTYFRRDPRIQWMPWEDDERKRIESALAFVRKEAMWTS